MSVKIMSEEDLLITENRAKLIKEWDEEANVARKQEAFKAYECLKDKTINYVLELLLKQFDLSTVQEMQYAMSNVSILRKVIDKLAKVYSNGCKRTLNNKSDTSKLEFVAEELDMNTAMAKTDKYLRTFKNTMVYIKPTKNELEKYDLHLEVKPPFHYDVVKDPNNCTEALAVVLSDYVPQRKTMAYIGDPSYAGRTGPTIPVINQTAAMPDTSGEDKRQFIWWSRNYHFTTNAKGEMLESESIENPILELPFVNFCSEQDGEFYAQGGQDLIDSGIKINTMITNVRHVAISQGFGQLYMTGKNLPKSVKVGPNHCVQMEYEEGEPVPSVGYLNSNPPIADLKSLIEMDVALMLTTNNLSTSGFSTSLSGSKDFASGIALMIDKSESIEDVEQQSRIFIENEPEIFEIVSMWHERLKASGELSEEWAQIQIPKNIEEMVLKLNSAKPILSELEQIDVLQKRKDLGLNTEVDLIMKDNPGMTEEEAQAKLEQIQAERDAKMAVNPPVFNPESPVEPAKLPQENMTKENNAG